MLHHFLVLPSFSVSITNKVRIDFWWLAIALMSELLKTSFCEGTTLRLLIISDVLVALRIPWLGEYLWMPHRFISLLQKYFFFLFLKDYFYSSTQETIKKVIEIAKGLFYLDLITIWPHLDKSVKTLTWP